ncbi:hypothetical protein IU500_19625 [Nocardia terpenica]|uniref:hypothetical protein n=1 Tax=Nocardia terpenica TaxID=455432 RepID=UPI00189542F1|nr:hypothetical protein [Nocardia terpenica]MBF6061951.1 hypothetical protein [Nocardia terpenica]MBF6106248.1 hypothetical protein [Nocardia terpenica]MBF6110371.1 hypothetical protein [Nocardia terpenica]MBF6120792.1 hypothetical protein [Nocardia terpenica]MBF6151707.1 hypothetical protein [Nocardia terpenica]
MNTRAWKFGRAATISLAAAAVSTGLYAAATQTAQQPETGSRYIAGASAAQQAGLPLAHTSGWGSGSGGFNNMAQTSRDRGVGPQHQAAQQR